MKKKGISPLIATVLLIGFAVALAAIVMTWGGGFIKKTTEETGTQSERALMCANLNLGISGGCDGNILIDNPKEISIMELTFRKFSKDGNLIGEPEPGGELGALESKTFNLGSLAGVYRIEVIPKLEGDIVCSEYPADKILNCAKEGEL